MPPPGFSQGQQKEKSSFSALATGSEGDRNSQGQERQMHGAT